MSKFKIVVMFSDLISIDRLFDFSEGERGGACHITQKWIENDERRYKRTNERRLRAKITSASLINRIFIQLNLVRAEGGGLLRLALSGVVPSPLNRLHFFVRCGAPRFVAASPSGNVPLK